MGQGEGSWDTLILTVLWINAVDSKILFGIGPVLDWIVEESSILERLGKRHLIKPSEAK